MLSWKFLVISMIDPVSLPQTYFSCPEKHEEGDLLSAIDWNVGRDYLGSLAGKKRPDWTRVQLQWFFFWDRVREGLQSAVTKTIRCVRLFFTSSWDAKGRIGKLDKLIQDFFKLKNRFLLLSSEHRTDWPLKQSWQKVFQMLTSEAQELLVEEEIRRRLKEGIGTKESEDDLEDRVKGAMLDERKREEALLFLFHLDGTNQKIGARKGIPFLIDSVMEKLCLERENEKLAER